MRIQAVSNVPEQATLSAPCCALTLQFFRIRKKKGFLCRLFQELKKEGSFVVVILGVKNAFFCRFLSNYR
jgi:hypothetical protein